jgi:uncharacterized protein (TIGR02265 family)
MQKVKGSVLKARLSYVKEQFGADTLQQVLDSLTEGDRKAVRTLLPIQWVPFEVGKRLDDAIVAVVGRGNTDFFERLGEASAEKNLTGAHQYFLAPGDPHAFLAKAPQIYRMYYQTGRREYDRIGEKEGVLTTHDAETFSAADCLTVIGWHRRALEMCGASGVEIVEEECRARGDEVCRYRVSWS